MEDSSDKSRLRFEVRPAEEQQTTPALKEEARELVFDHPEEMLRHDALHTPVPPAISRRLAKSTADLPQPSVSWWKRIFGGGA